MQKTDYMEIRNHLSFSKPIWVTLLIIAIDWLILYAAIYCLHMGSTVSFLFSQLLLAVFYFHNFALLHEAGHGNVHKDRWVNTVVGHYASIFCFLPYFPWKLIHQEHHVWAGNIDKDPTMAKIKKAREEKKISPIFAFAWKSWVPLAAFAQQSVFWNYPIAMWKGDKMTPKVFAQSLFSVLWLVAVYVTLNALFPETVTFGNFWLSYVIYMVLTELVNFPHHLQMPTFHTSPARNKLHPWEQHISTRSCDYGIFSELLALNFNFHIEHHFFPNLPWYRLRGLRKHVKAGLANDYTEIKGIGWNLKNRKIGAADIILPEVTHPLLQP